MSRAALSCRGVSVRYEQGTAPVLEGLSFTVAAGERLAVVGLNGAGKTTLLLALVGLVPHDGEIEICGRRLTRGSAAELRRGVGFLFNVPEDQLLFPTALEDAAFGLVRAGIGAAEARDRARASLDSLGVGYLAERPLHHLSHGQKQRVALAGALVTSPPLLLLDEPTAGLDPPGRRDLATLLADRDAAQIIATHDLELVDALCSRVLLLDGGTLADDRTDTGPIRRRWLVPPS